MRKFFIAAMLTAGLGVFGLSATRADDAKKGEKSEGEEVKGVLIDNNCGDKQKDEESAAGHPKACAAKDGCAASGYQIVVGEKHYKFDEKGNELAKEYLKVEENTTKVTVKGEVKDDGTIAVTEISQQEEEGDKKEGKKA